MVEKLNPKIRNKKGSLSESQSDDELPPAPANSFRLQPAVNSRVIENITVSLIPPESKLRCLSLEPKEKNPVRTVKWTRSADHNKTIEIRPRSKMGPHVSFDDRDVVDYEPTNFSVDDLNDMAEKAQGQLQVDRFFIPFFDDVFVNDVNRLY